MCSEVYIVSLTRNTTLLPIEARSPPDVGPGPLANEPLSGSGGGVGVVSSPVQVLVAKDPPGAPSAPLRRVDGAGCRFSGL